MKGNILHDCTLDQDLFFGNEHLCWFGANTIKLNYFLTRLQPVLRLSIRVDFRHKQLQVLMMGCHIYKHSLLFIDVFIRLNDDSNIQVATTGEGLPRLRYREGRKRKGSLFTLWEGKREEIVGFGGREDVSSDIKFRRGLTV